MSHRIMFHFAGGWKIHIKFCVNDRLLAVLTIMYLYITF